MLLTVALGIPLGLILIPRFSTVGLIVTILLAGVLGLIVGIWYVKKRFNATIDFVSSIKTISASMLSALIMFIILSRLFSQAGLNW